MQFFKFNSLTAISDQTKTVSNRNFSISSKSYVGKRLEDFRLREEKREAEYNEKPLKSAEQQEECDVTELKNKVLEASLPFVKSYGWTREAIVKGAEEVQFPGVHGMFSRGGVELVNYFYLKCNNELIEDMRQKVGEKRENVVNPKDFLCYTLQRRLEKLEPFVNTWPQALAIMALPQNVPTSLANLLTLADDICYFSGDRSVEVI